VIKKDLRPYELSLWTLQDSFITILKGIGLSNKGQIETPKCKIKDDGTQELTFSIPMYYYEKGALVENPIWYNVINGSLIVNLRKLKLIFNKGKEGEEVFEFVINKVTETHENGELHCEVTAEGLAFQELGKVGYKVSLKADDFINEYNEWYNSSVGEEKDYLTEEDKAAAEPVNNLNYWCDKLFKNSRWDYEIQMDWSSYDGITVEMSNEMRESRGLRRTDKIYEEEYISSWEYTNNGLVPSNLENFKEKLRLVDLEKSNTYNNSQKLAETFGIFCKYKYEYDDNYHIIGKKCIFYNNFLSEKDGKIDIIYPYDASKIEREIDSADLVTKMFVTSVEDDTSPSGLISIIDVTANKLKEDYILNFDYLYSIGTISQEQYDAIADYERSMFNINTELEPIGMQIANLQNDLVTYQAQLTLSKESQTLDKEQMEQSTTLLNSITKNTGVLYKNLDTPYRGVLLNSPDNDGTYYIKITQEGVDIAGQIEYPLKEGGNKIKGIRIYYYAKVPGENEGSIATVLRPYDLNQENESSAIIYPNSIKIDTDEFNNIISLSNISLREDAVSKNYLITFGYKPELHYQNIYDTYAKKLAIDEAAEKEADAKIKEIEEKIKKLKERYNSLLEEKSILISDFENMMGPALKEGSWQAENYKDYGSKFTGKINSTDSTKHIRFMWDEEPFEEEQLLYYELGTDLQKIFYPCIDISNYLDILKENLDNISFIYNLKEPNKIEQMTIGSQMEFAFIKEDEIVKPVLLLTDTNFEKTAEVLESCFIGIISSSLNENGIEVATTTLIKNSDIQWIENNENSIIVYPRMEVNTLLLKTSEDELIIKYNNETLRNYYDYSVLIRGESYFITIKNKIMLKDAIINKTFDIAYSISNAALSLYLDALEVSKTNSMPQVSYTIDVSAWNEKFIKYDYNNLNRIVGINDSELKFEDVQGYISELELDLDKPWEDEITIKNYKTKFEDLFSTIVASSEQMKTNSFAYNNAASAFGPSGTLKPSIIQNTINQSDLTYAFQSGNLTIDEINGIWARSDAGVVAVRGGGIFCATQQDSNGNWLWNTGIMPSGINASLITAGQIDTNLIKIYAGDNLRLQLNADGLFAYNTDSLGEANLNQYIVHNSDGLFSTIINPNDPSDKIDLVEVSWDGFILRDENGNIVFNADRLGNLNIVGTITAKDGSIGNWLISPTGLVYNEGTAGLAPQSGIIHDVTGSEKILWVESTLENGEKTEFVVTSGGTLYCNDIIVKGTISAGSFIGNTSVDEVDEQLRSISISVLDGTTFSFTNRNYDNNLIISPLELKFKISTGALTNEELCKQGNSNPLEGYKFYYSLDEISWTQIDSNENLIWKPDYLTFILKSDIMYLGCEETSTEPQTTLFFKVEKEGKQREVDFAGNISYKDFIYSDTIQLVSEKVGLSKYVSPIDPPSYTFLQEANENEITFSTQLTGFNAITDKDSLENSYWSINGKDCQLRAKLDEEILEGEGFKVSLNSQENIIIASIIVSSSIIPEDKSITLTYKIDQAVREAVCFKTKGGTDGINIIIRSSSGDSLVSGDTETKLSVEIYYGSQLMNSDSTTEKFFYVWKKDGYALPVIKITETETMSSDNDDFFKQKKIHLSAADFGLKAIYQCEVFTTIDEARQEYEFSSSDSLLLD
jgi:hypothetical protein